MFREIWGDLIEEFHKGTVDIMIHGCNCFHLMGAGIARSIKSAYPQVFHADLKTPLGEPRKLGTYSTFEFSENKKIINMYTQFSPGANFEYSALIKAMKTLNKEYKDSKLIFGFPLIGAGIGGGKWPIIKNIIEEYGKDLNIIIVHYDEGDKTVGATRANLESEIKRLK
jgi:O-acetyl-ADP-ribose deacetylase (regulator of RNase III)